MRSGAGAHRNVRRAHAPAAATPSSASDAGALVEANFAANAIIEALDAKAYVDLVRRVAASQIAGGRTYDTVIGECAHRAGASVLLTFNRRHFEPAPRGVQIVEPTLT